MREIKFRAWDKRNNVMIDWFDISQSTWNTGLSSLMYHILVSNKPDYEIMQFCGLTDKNGKEIYEGDIFQVAGKHKYIVKYMESGESDYELRAATFVIWLNDTTFFPFDEYAMKNGEIIGNIYESTELLNL